MNHGDPMRLISVFLDGTWNDREDVPENEVPTNIARLEALYKDETSYVHGVGSRTSFPFTFLEGAFGFGAKERVASAY